jgi:hypothetical protein
MMHKKIVMILFFRGIRCEGSIDERKLEFFKKLKISSKKFKDEDEEEIFMLREGIENDGSDFDKHICFHLQLFIADVDVQLCNSP